MTKENQIGVSNKPRRITLRMASEELARVIARLDTELPKEKEGMDALLERLTKK